MVTRILIVEDEATLRETLAYNLTKEGYRAKKIVIVTHNMQQAARVSDYTAMMMMRSDRAGEVIEFDVTAKIFTRPRDQRTEDYVTGRFG